MVASAPLQYVAPQTMHREVFRWKPRPAMTGAPAYLLPWLADPGSLTARIVSRSSRFEVRVLREALDQPFADERGLIGLRHHRYAWVREVLLIADGIPVVFAHSALALRDLTGAWHMARAIGSRPLGAALFADPGISREPLRSARLPINHPLHRHAEAAVGKTLPPLWGRRSRFCRNNRPLLVTEVFLPGIAEL
jgi:chorismate--pyruvate lyase